MSKVSKEFWVSDDFIKDNQFCDDFSVSRKCRTVFKNKVTVTYEIDREVTIKESDIDKLFSNNTRFTHKDIEIIKEKLFGGGDNE